MTLKSYPAFAFILALSFACQQNPATPAAEEGVTVKADTVEYSINTLSSTVPCKSDSTKNCLEVAIDEVTITSAPTEKAAEQIENYLREAIGKTDNSESAPKNPKAIISNFEAEYRQIVKDMPSYDLPWQHTQEYSPYLNAQGLFGVKLNSYSFTGGAHGNAFIYYFTFDSHSGKLLKLGDLFNTKHRETFVAMAEEQFVDTREIDTSDTYEDAGYWFEDNDFSLNNNFHYSRNGLEILYNPYEIAPYSEGIITLSFPYSEIKDLLKPEYRF